MPHPLRSLALYLTAGAALALAACDAAEEEPLAPGTFEVTVTGDAEAEHTGGPVYVAAPDSTRGNVGSPDEYWSVEIPIVFESSLADGDAAEVLLLLSEPDGQASPFTEVPEGTFGIGSDRRGPSEPGVFVEVQTARLDVGADDGRLRLRRVAGGGLVGDLEGGYTQPHFNGTVSRGRIRLRFHALAERPPAPDEQ